MEILQVCDQQQLPAMATAITGWIDQQMDGWMDGWVDGWMAQRKDE